MGSGEQLSVMVENDIFYLFSFLLINELAVRHYGIYVGLCASLSLKLY